METSTIVNIILAILSFVLAAISVITVIISLKQNKKLLESNEKQLKEMRMEHQLSTQPIVFIDEARFIINRPRLFYTPPEDKYSFQSTYDFEAKVSNVSSSVAICVDMTAELVVSKEDDEYGLQTISRRYNIICRESEPEKLTLGISGDSSALIYEALRESDGKKLPRICVEALYRNATGGFFKSKQEYILIPQEEDTEVIRSWHTNISSASIEAKEAIDAMKQAKQHDERWDKVFNLTKKIFDAKLGSPEVESIIIKCMEKPEKYVFTTLEKGQYEECVSKHGYGHYIHKCSDCNPKNT